MHSVHDQFPDHLQLSNDIRITEALPYKASIFFSQFWADCYAFLFFILITGPRESF